MEKEGQEEEQEGTVALDSFTVGGGFRLAAEAELTVPFTVALPWETPITELHGQHLGPVLGIRTELEIAGARDKRAGLLSGDTTRSTASRPPTTPPRGPTGTTGSTAG